MITSDKVDEENETFTFTLSDPTGGELSATSASVTTTIEDNDTRGIMLSEATPDDTEGSTASYTVQLTSQPTDTVTVTVGAAGDVSVDTSAAMGNQNTLTFTPSNWNTAQPVGGNGG